VKTASSPNLKPERVVYPLRALIEAAKTIQQTDIALLNPKELFQ